MLINYDPQKNIELFYSSVNILVGVELSLLGGIPTKSVLESRERTFSAKGNVHKSK